MPTARQISLTAACFTAGLWWGLSMASGQYWGRTILISALLLLVNLTLKASPPPLDPSKASD